MRKNPSNSKGLLSMLLITSVLFSGCQKEDTQDIPLSVHEKLEMTTSTSPVEVKNIDVSKVTYDSGHAYLLKDWFGVGGDTQWEKPSTLKVYENGLALGPAHSSHDDVRTIGQGRFSHWGNELFFTASDNTDPRTNGRKYTYTINESVETTTSLSVPSNAKSLDLSIVTLHSGNAYQLNAWFGVGGDTKWETTSTLKVFENDKELGPAHSLLNDVVATGKGKFSHFGNNLYFSSSDNTDPRTNGRKYTYTIDGSSPTTTSTAPGPTLGPVTNGTALKNMFGVNTYEWNFLQDPNNPSNGSTIYEPKMALIRNFDGIRHYMDWEKLEDSPGNYTFNPTRRGGWNFDAIYQRCKQEGIFVLSCLKEAPNWLYNTYPEGQRDANNVPAPYGSNLEDPASYIAQARAAFQFAARYGANRNVDPTLVKVNATPRWTNDPVNEVKIGMDLVKYIEADNERDRWWVGPRAYQTGRQYAAHLSAFYDGHKGRLGRNVGVKTADPSMKVVMAGLSKADVNYVKEMIAWCRENRGYRADGSVDLCFDVINYHLYSNDNQSQQWGTATRGVAPELSEIGRVADEFVTMSRDFAKGIEVWVTEAGYDINSASPQRAIASGNKTALITQADWILRTSLLYARRGIKKLFFYQLFDDNKYSPIQYGSSGLVEVEGGLKRRPAADYILQATNLMGNYKYQQTIGQDPLVDVYDYNGRKMYVLLIPDEKGRTGSYVLNLGTATSATIYNLQPGSSAMTAKKVVTNGGNLTVSVTETPIFVQAD
ncbi:MAG: hypothetical protein WBJ10_04745 [Daejeonella sp.]|uniref:hypothetical protein n=1 Tax=Daejeonella sp. TaxID=2805397 RepID=UPI003C71F67A